jgi:hypothetical protein
LPKDLRHESRQNPGGALCPQRLHRSRKLKETHQYTLSVRSGEQVEQ